ncbi:MAG TPA: adenylate/guanylate cyclase domain-containing protein [Roseiarcus sp.]
MPSLRQIRLATGLVLFTYVTLHFVNHALGNISVEAMDNGLVIQKAIWQSLPGALILYLSLFTHMSLGFWALYARRHFRWTRLEATQLVLGLSIPFLLADHFVGTRVALSQFGLEKSYEQEFLKFWVNAPIFGALQAILLLIVWIHGCLGVHFWLRLKPFYPAVKELLLAIAVLLPTLALLGYYQGGERTLQSVQDPAWRARNMSPDHVGTPAQNAVLLDDRTRTLALLAAALGAVFFARGLRGWRERRGGSIRLTYPDRTIRAPRGFSVLEASLINNIPHAHVCGGRGRCSTCRIRVLGDLAELPAPSAAEQAVLERVHARTGVRLACQLRPTGDIAFVPMVSPHATTVDAYRTGSAYSGVERYVVIMFVDMRGSSRLAEGRLPFDTVFVINQFLNAVSSAVLSAGGEPNQVLGDGLLALFGMGAQPEVACRQAVAACAAIAAKVETLNNALTHVLREPIRFGIGIHAGVTIAGNIGYERHAQFTVIGDAVNVAARLEEMTKTFACEVIMSEEVYERAGFGPDDLPAHDVAPRGREAGMKARSAVRAADLAGFIVAQEPAAS